MTYSTFLQAAYRCAVLLTAWLGVSLSAHAAYPETNVRIVVPFPPGAAADASTRVLAKKLGDYWGQVVIVDNRPGVHGMQHVAAAPADGYTFLLGAASGIVTMPLMNPKITYRPERDFVPVARVQINPPVLVANASAGIKSVSELVAHAKAKPGKVFFASAGIGSPSHLAMELFMRTTGTEMVHIPYKGGAPAVNDLLGGQVQISMNAIPSVLQHLKSGKLIALAVASSTRSRALPDVPTLIESGYPEIDYDGWYALFAPTGTPPAIINKVSADVQRAVREPDVAASLLLQGGESAPSTAPELGAFIKRETSRWSKIIKERKLRLED